jgi:hypothetical protein
LCGDTGLGNGGAWNRDGVVLFASEIGPLRKVKVVNGAADGMCTAVTKPEPGAIRDQLPEFLPDGNHFFFLTGTPGQRHVYLAALNDPKPRMVLADNTGAIYAPPAEGAKLGHLLFLRDATLMAQPFDEGSLATVGDPFAVVSPASGTTTTPQVAASVTVDGMLLYLAAPSQESELTWFDRRGKPVGKAGQRANQGALSLSPDGTKAMTSVAGNQGTRLFDLLRGTQSRYDARGLPVVWAPEGAQVAYFISGKLYRASAAGGNEEELLESSNPVAPSQWTKDGRFLFYTENNPKTRGDIWYLPDPGGKPRTPVKFLATDGIESQAQLSPDGHWVAYTSSETGRDEVWLRSFPDGGNKTPVSLIGGREPRWRADGKELFFVNAAFGDLRTMMAVPVQSGAKLTLGAPEQLFNYRSRTTVIQNNAYQYAPSADGQKFLITLQADETEPTLNLVTDWHRLIQAPGNGQ